MVINFYKSLQSMRNFAYKFAIFMSFAFVFVALTDSGVMAQSSDVQFEGNRLSQLRLIGAKTEWQGKDRLVAGIEIKLAPKWKTYWRTPGDTGIPPFFDWSGSENLARADVLFPTPHRFKDPSGMTIGYKSDVTLPVVLTPKDPSKPVKLKLDAQYAICHDLCVPVNAKQALTVDGTGSNKDEPLVSMALSMTPLLVDGPQSKLGVQEIRYLTTSKAPQLNLKVQVPQGTKKTDLFVEGENGLYVPTPKMDGKADASSGRLNYRIDLGDVDDPAKFQTAKLNCTVVADYKSITQPCSVQ